MFFDNRSLIGISICALMFASDHSTNANDVGKVVEQSIELQTAEVDVLKARLELETWNCSQVQDFYNKGFASWLELRRQQLNVAAFRTRLDSATEFQKFLSQVATESAAASDDELIPLRLRTSKPVKVFVPGSIRLIGWIEGQALADFKADNTEQPQVDLAEERLAKAQQRYDAHVESSSPEHHRRNAWLRLNLAQAELKHAKLIAGSLFATNARRRGIVHFAG